MSEAMGHGYGGWRNSAAYCLCGRTFDSVQDLERHVIRPTAESEAVTVAAGASEGTTA